MAKRTGWYVLMAMTATLWWQSSCSAQAFFPLQRVDDTTVDTRVDVLLNSAANDAFAGPNIVGPTINVTDTDTNETIVNEDSSADDGGSSAESSAIAEAEVLPAAGSSLMLAQCISSIGGLWDLISSTTGFAMMDNNQSASAGGAFEILENSTYPEVGTGTLHATFTINFESADWGYCEVDVVCGDTSILVTCSDGFYYMEGYIAGVGMVGGFGESVGPLVYTASQEVQVGDIIGASARVMGETNGRTVNFGVTDSAIPGILVTTSFYVSER